MTKIHNKNQFKSQKEFLEKDSIWKVVLKLTAPTVLMFFAVALYGLVDTILATQLTTDYSGYDENTAVIAMGYALSYIAILQTFTILINVGSVIHYSTLIANGSHSEAKKFIGSSITGTAIFNALVAIIGIIIARPMIELISGENVININDIDAAVKYSQSAAVTIVIYGLYDLLIRYIRTMGKPLSSSLIGISGLPINLLFDYIFMGILGTGIEGGAYATIIGFSFTLGMALLYLYFDKKKNNQHVILSEWKNFIPKFNFILLAMTLGFAAFFRNILTTIDSYAFSAFTNSIQFESSTIEDREKFLSSATSVYSQINTLIISIMRGITQGSVVVLAYNYGKKNHDKLKEGIKWMFIYMIIVILIIAIIVYPLIPKLAELLTNGESLSYGKEINYAITAMVSSSLVYGFVLVVYGFLNSTKQIKSSLLATVFSTIIVFFTVIPLMANFAIWEVAVWSLFITYFISAVVLIPYGIYILKNLEKTFEMNSKVKNHM